MRQISASFPKEATAESGPPLQIAAEPETAPTLVSPAKAVNIWPIPLRG